SPVGQETPGSAFAQVDRVGLNGLRVAVSIDLDGAFEVDHQVAGVVREQARALEDAGAIVLDRAPVLHEAEDTFRTLRAWHFQASYGELLAEHPDGFKKSLADNIRAGASLTGRDVAR